MQMTESELNRLSDTELLRRARHSEPSFAAFYRRHAHAVYAWFLSEATAHEAADLTAETFAQVLVSLHRFRGQRPESGVAWLFGIAKNQQRQLTRRQRVDDRARRKLRMPLHAMSDQGYDEVEERDLAERLRPSLLGAVEILPENHRRAVELRVVDELPYSTVASLLGCSEQAARIRVLRGLRQLRGQLLANGGTP